MANKLPEILQPDLEFELPYKKDNEGYYRLLPNTKFIGSKDALRKLAQKKVKIGYVYLINIIGTSKYKIGVSTNPKRRLTEISNILPFEVKVLAVNRIKNPFVFEEELINQFKSSLIKNEWFDLTIENAKYIMITLHNQQVKELNSN